MWSDTWSWYSQARHWNVRNSKEIRKSESTLQRDWSCFEKLGCVVWLQSPALEVVRRLSMKPDELSKRPLLAGAIGIEDREEREKFLQEKIQNLMDKR